MPYTAEEQEEINRYEVLRERYMGRITAARANNLDSPMKALLEVVTSDAADQEDAEMVNLENRLPKSYVYPGDEDI